MILLTTLHHTSTERFAEYLFCLEKNIKSGYFHRIIIFDEHCNFMDSIPKDERIHIIPIDDRLNYSQLIKYCNGNFADEVCVIANTDIYFDDSLLEIHKVELTNKFIVITRLVGENKYQNPGSFDTYIFKPDKTGIISNFYPDIFIGIDGCDSYLAQKAKEAGLKVYNPCLTIKTHHHHKVNGGNTYVLNDGRKYWSFKDYSASEIKYCTVYDCI